MSQHKRFYLPLLALCSLICGVWLNTSSVSAYELTMNLSTNILDVNIAPTSSNGGTFAKSSDASISVSTDYNYGYTLSIAATDSTNLKNSSDNTSVISSIDSIVSESDFKSSTSYSNQWGFSPSKYYDNGSIITNTNRDFLPSPSTSGSVIDITTVPNPENANTYALSIGAKVNHELSPGTYANTFILTAVANSVPYVVNYYANTADPVTNLPDPQIGSTYETSITLSDTKPSRGDYGFYGWCTEPTTTVDGCSTLGGTTYRAKATYDLNASGSNTLNLYAIWGTYSELDIGQTVNEKMKTLAAGGTPVACNTDSSDIKAIRMADSLPTGFTPSEANTISIASSTHPATYIWFDNTDDAGILYVYTSADKVRMNTDSSRVFRSNIALTDISGIANWDTSTITNMSYLFTNCPAIISLHSLENWDTSNITNLYLAFGIGSTAYNNGMRSQLSDISALANWDTSSATSFQCMLQYTTSLTSLHGLENWDTSSVISLRSIFYYDSSLTDISALTKWDVSNVTDLSHAFRGTAISDISPLAKWKTSNVTNMQCTFSVISTLTSLHGLEEWDISNVTDLSHAFRETAVSDISPLANWNVSNVTNLQSTFNDTSSLTSLHGLEDWDTPNVNNMSWTFSISAGQTKVNDAIMDLTPLAKWDVSNVTTMDSMFQNNNIASFLPLKNWKVGKVQNFSNTFNQTDKSTTTTLAGLENWNVSNATNMSMMFADSVSLTDASAINNWDIRNVVPSTGSEDDDEGFNKMFSNSFTYPTFTLRPGTWTASGTFIPTT